MFQAASFFTVYFIALFCGIYVFQFADLRPPDKKASMLTNFNRYVSSLLLTSLPHAFRRSLKFVIRETAFNYLAAALDYALNQRNPLLQILYLLIINGAYIAWLCLGQPQLPTYFVPAYHKWLIFAGIAGCQFAFVLACSASPGVVTRASQQAYDERYPYDGTVYVEGLQCDTCKTKKVARSKHCRLCNKCVSRFDHHW
jgi:palmitoyltransferase